MQPVHLFTADESAGAVRVDRFPEPPRPVNTLNIYTANYVGVVTIEASIKLNPTDDDWFVIHIETFEPFVSNETKRRVRAANVTGRFLWMRATAVKDPVHPLGIVDRVTVI